MLSFLRTAWSGGYMRRREFITLIGGAAASWPVLARAQQSDRVRRIGVLINRAADDPAGRASLKAFQQGLRQIGWSDGPNGGLTSAGALTISTAIAETPRNWSSTLRMTSSEFLCAPSHLGSQRR